MKRVTLPERPLSNQIEAAYPIIMAAMEGLSEARAKRLAADIYECFVQTSPPPDTGGLTRRQAQIMQAIQDYVDQHGYAPTQEELAVLANIKHRADCVEFLAKLSNKGFILNGSGWREIVILRRI